MGPVPALLRIGAAAAGIWLLFRLASSVGNVGAKLLRCMATVAVAVALTATSEYLARDAFQLFPDRLPFVVQLWVGTAFFGMALAVSAAMPCFRWRPGVTALVAASLIFVASANEVNGVYAAYPTSRDFLGLAPADDIVLPTKQVHSLPRTVAGALESHWRLPPDLSTSGKLTSAMIPGRVSGFLARMAKIYLPPAYFAQPPPRLPVLVLLSGQPGMPQDWLSAGKLMRTMDRFVKAHHGLSPIVVVPDATGSQFADPLCLNSARGNVDAYLARTCRRGSWLTCRSIPGRMPGQSEELPTVARARFNLPPTTPMCTRRSSTSQAPQSRPWVTVAELSPKSSVATRRHSAASIHWICFGCIAIRRARAQS